MVPQGGEGNAAGRRPGHPGRDRRGMARDDAEAGGVPAQVGERPAVAHVDPGPAAHASYTKALAWYRQSADAGVSRSVRPGPDGRRPRRRRTLSRRRPLLSGKAAPRPPARMTRLAWLYTSTQHAGRATPRH